MAGSEFDDLSRALAAAPSRRRMLSLLAGGVASGLAGLVGVRPALADDCNQAGRNCKKNNECCDGTCCNKVCCANGQVCTNNQCACPAGSTLCGGRCVACPTGQTLNPTTCACSANAATCPPGVCPSGTTRCGIGCCPAGQICQNGQCITCTPVCAQGTTACGGGCCPAGQTCQNGKCAGSGGCAPGSANCDGNTANGCETNIMTDVMNCGSCGAVCAPPNATGACVNGNCEIAFCNPGFFNCDGVTSNGCETDTVSDPFNCGACGNVCAAGQTCANGVCSGGGCPPPQSVCGSGCCNEGAACGTGGTITCFNGTCQCVGGGGCTPATTCPTGQNCGTAPDGCGGIVNCGICQAPQTCGGGNVPNQCGCTPRTCPSGACGDIPNGCGGTITCNCPTGQTCQTGVCVTPQCTTNAQCGPCGVCSSGVCVAAAANTVCRASTGPCDPAEFCTGSSLACPPDTRASNGTPCGSNATCVNGVCQPCPGGTHLCGNVCASNLSTQSCGASCTACPSGPNGVATCNGTACGFTCDTGFADCNPTVPGCETNVQDDPNNCGACGRVCGGLCGPPSNPGFFECQNGSCVCVIL